MRVSFFRLGIVFTIGAVFYPAIELLWRGYTHPTMALLGGICFAFIYEIHENLSFLPLFYRAFLCCAVISALEFIFGFVLNILLSLDVWDYSREYMNLYGQICLAYCIAWLLLSLACAPLCHLLKRLLVRIESKYNSNA